MADFPSITWVNVDGVSVPMIEAQHFTGKGNQTVRTGESHPLPVKDSAVLSALMSGSIEEMTWKQGDTAPTPKGTRAIGARFNDDKTLSVFYFTGKKWEEVL